MRKENTMKRLFHISLCAIVGLVIAFMAGYRNAWAQDLKAYTKPSPGTYVYLSWAPDTTSAPVRYNIYRKLVSEYSA
jgi:hypothetical protein